jgi:hypothetical protein
LPLPTSRDAPASVFIGKTFHGEEHDFDRLDQALTFLLNNVPERRRRKSFIITESGDRYDWPHLPGWPA